MVFVRARVQVGVQVGVRAVVEIVRARVQVGVWGHVKVLVTILVRDIVEIIVLYHDKTANWGLYISNILPINVCLFCENKLDCTV